MLFVSLNLLNYALAIAITIVNYVMNICECQIKAERDILNVKIPIVVLNILWTVKKMFNANQVFCTV